MSILGTARRLFNQPVRQGLQADFEHLATVRAGEGTLYLEQGARRDWRNSLLLTAAVFGCMYWTLAHPEKIQAHPQPAGLLLAANIIMAAGSQALTRRAVRRSSAFMRSFEDPQFSRTRAYLSEQISQLG